MLSKRLGTRILTQTQAKYPQCYEAIAMNMLISVVLLKPTGPSTLLLIHPTLRSRYLRVLKWPRVILEYVINIESIYLSLGLLYMVTLELDKRIEAARPQCTTQP